MRCEWIDEEWTEDLSWCPSQCYRRIRCNGRIYTLYLRWRWEDPWQFSIAEGDMLSQRGLFVIDFRRGQVGRLIGFDEEGEPIVEELKWRFITGDLFAELGLFFRDEEYRQAERKAEEIFFEWIKKRCLGSSDDAVY